MGFDGLTFAAQVVNFLILVWLLNRFLFGRITEAMERREQRIADRLAEAAELRREAEVEGRSFRQMERELADRREEILEKARSEAADRRTELVAEARRDVERDEARWREGLEREKGAFLRELRQRTAGEVLALCRRTLEDLAGENLEARVADRLVERLADLGDEDRRRLKDALDEPGATLRVESAFPVAEAQRRRIEQVLAGLAQVENSTWRERPELGFGFKLRAGGWQLGWSLETQLDALEERVGELLSGPAGDRPGGDGPATASAVAEEAS